MKKLIAIPALLLAFISGAQDTIRKVEPELETSFTNEDLLLLALAGFAVLIAIYFLFRRAKKRRMASRR